MSSLLGFESEFISTMDKEQIVFLAGVTVCALSIGAFIFWGPNPRPRRRGGVIGLQNLGLTCFMNTLLQAMASCATFVEWLESCHEQGNVASALFYLLKVLSTERSRLPVTLEDPLTPSSLIEALRQHGWSISHGEQDAHELFHLLMVTLEEEAHKAMAVEGGLTDALEPKKSRTKSVSESLNVKTLDEVKADTNNVNPIEGNHISFTEADISVGDTCKKTSEVSGDSISKTQSLPPSLRLKNKQGDVITRSMMLKYDVNRNYQVSPFCGMLTSQLQCVKCNFKSVLRFDKFDSLSLHLPEPPRGRHTLSQLLENFTRTEAVTGVACDGCNKERDPSKPLITSTSLKTLSIGKLPKCLCIHIHRMSMASDGTPYKRRDYIDFPEFLVMDPYTHNSMIKEQKIKSESNSSAENNNDAAPSNSVTVLPCRTESWHHIYRLKAVVVHSGSVDSGHFITYRRGPLQSNTRHRSDRWYFTSDEVVKDSTLAEAMKATAYMLFYEKCTMTPT